MTESVHGRCGIMVTGVMQDGGLPHIGCRCPRCAAAYRHPRRQDYAAALAIIDDRRRDTAVWLIDATPDIRYQLNMLAPLLRHPARAQRLRQPDAILLTHGHMGHIGGLPQLGPEAMDVRQLPVYGPPGLCRLLQNSPVWRPLLTRLELRPLPPGIELTIGPQLTASAVPVPHRDEWQAGTYAYRIQGPERSLLYVPDIDSWDLWPEAETELAAVDIALVDGSFYSPQELDGRTPAAHPLVTDTLDRFAALPTELYFTHLNHTNPLLDKGSDVRREVIKAGMRVARTGQLILL